MRAANLGVVAVLGFSHGALPNPSAPPYLRGSNAYDFEFSGYKRWAGAYGGVHGGYSSATMNFGHSAESLLGFIGRNSILNSEAGVPDWTVPRQQQSGGHAVGRLRRLQLAMGRCGARPRGQLQPRLAHRRVVGRHVPDHDAVRPIHLHDHRERG